MSCWHVTYKGQTRWYKTSIAEISVFACTTVGLPNSNILITDLINSWTIHIQPHATSSTKAKIPLTMDMHTPTHDHIGEI